MDNTSAHPLRVKPTEDSGLFPDEFFWRAHYTWLQDQGYLLRPRYHPNWTPSWHGTKKDADECEDGQFPLVRL